MRLEWLEDILAVAETGSFSEAAERRHLTQSAFSRRIQNIEDFVGAPLFDRSRKPVQLTPSTSEQRDRIARLAAELRDLAQDLRRGERGAGQRVALASQHALTTAVARDLIRDLLAAESDLLVRLRSANLDECFAALLARQADIALVYRMPGGQHPIATSYIQSLTIGGDLLVPVCAEAEQAATAAALEQGHLPLIGYPREVFLGQVVAHEVLPKLPDRLRPLRRIDTALTTAALELASQGLGVAWVPQSLVHARAGSARLAQLDDVLPTCRLDITAVRVMGHASPAAARAWQQLAQNAPPQ